MQESGQAAGDPGCFVRSSFDSHEIRERSWVTADIHVVSETSLLGTLR